MCIYIYIYVYVYMSYLKNKKNIYIYIQLYTCAMHCMIIIRRPRGLRESVPEEIEHAQQRLETSVFDGFWDTNYTAFGCFEVPFGTPL